MTRPSPRLLGSGGSMPPDADTLAGPGPRSRPPASPKPVPRDTDDDHRVRRMDLPGEGCTAKLPAGHGLCLDCARGLAARDSEQEAALRWAAQAQADERRRMPGSRTVL